MTKHGVVVAALIASGFVWPAVAQPPERIPPRVVEVDPPPNSVDVDPNRRTISVTFDRHMQTERAWSWIILGPFGLYPGSGEDPWFSDDGLTCTLPVRLTPQAVYAVGINSARHTGFKDTSGIPALSYGWAFATGGYSPEELPPRVVRTDPPHSTADVDPPLTEISVTFDRPMRKHTWSWVREPQRGEYPGSGEGEPRFSDDGLTCALPVRLSPGTVYAVSINGYQYTGFKSRSGTPCIPFAWAFKTSGAATATAATTAQADAGQTADRTPSERYTQWLAQTIPQMQAFAPTVATSVLDIEGEGRMRSVSGPEGILWLGREDWVYIRSYSTHDADPQTILARDRKGNIYRGNAHACPSFSITVPNDAPIDSLEAFLQTQADQGGWELVQPGPATGEDTPALSAREHRWAIALSPNATTPARTIALRYLIAQGGEEDWQVVRQVIGSEEAWQARAEALRLAVQRRPEEEAELRSLFTATLPAEPTERSRVLGQIITETESQETLKFVVSFVTDGEREHLCDRFQAYARNHDHDKVFWQFRPSSFWTIRNSVGAYGVLDPEGAAHFYRSLVHSQSPNQRAVGIFAVGELRLAEALADLVAAAPAHEENWLFGSSLCVALGKISTSEAHEELVRLLLSKPGDRGHCGAVIVIMEQVCGLPGASPPGAWWNGCWSTVADDPVATAERFAEAMRELAATTENEPVRDRARNAASYIVSQAKRHR